MNRKEIILFFRATIVMSTGALVVPIVMAINSPSKNKIDKTINKNYVKCKKSFGGHIWHVHFDSMSEKNKANLNQLRTKYFNETNDILERINNRNIELRRELSKELPDQDIVHGLNNQIFDLNVKLSDKTTNYESMVRKFFPDYFHGMANESSIISSSTNISTHCNW